MRFLIEFIVFGIIFYAIFLYLPEVFQVMVSAAAKLFDMIRDGINALIGRVQSTPGGVPAHSFLPLLAYVRFSILRLP